jgi:TolA-binding protein
MREREGVIARIRQIRRASAAEDQAATATAAPGHDQLRALEARVNHLEQLLQGLQDSVHRESSRNDKRVADLEAQIQPAAIGKALSDDARARGL